MCVSFTSVAVHLQFVTFILECLKIIYGIRLSVCVLYMKSIIKRASTCNPKCSHFLKNVLLPSFFNHHTNYYYRHFPKAFHSSVFFALLRIRVREYCLLLWAVPLLSQGEGGWRCEMLFVCMYSSVLACVCAGECIWMHVCILITQYWFLKPKYIQYTMKQISFQWHKGQSGSWHNLKESRVVQFTNKIYIYISLEKE